MNDLHHAVFDDYTDYEEIAEQLPEGSQVSVRPDFGSGQPVCGTVLGHGEKNGRALIDYSFHREGQSRERWAYVNQIDAVLRVGPRAE
ncbi:hypothetical protein [Streptomyces sp. NPDC057302]|uniref:hypothetical protein n=1 Tax=Streptomyces sp. NPDC057302 TaxID=3346094 RepID=UPI003626124A